jgi:hypothetical protein
MRVTMRSGERSVDIRLGGKPTARDLRTVERAARRLFAALPEPPAEPAQQPFGFSLSSDTDLAPDPEPPADDDEDDQP